MTSADTRDKLVSKTFDLVGQTFSPDDLAMKSLIDACFDNAEFKNKSVLDVGCGTGIASLHFARNGAARVVGVDVSNESISNGTKQAAREGLKNADFRQANTLSLPFKDGSFDIVLSIGVLPYVEEIDLAIRELTRVVAEGGTVLIFSLRKTKWDFILELARKIASIVPFKYALPCSKFLAFLCKPLSAVILKRKESKSGKTLQQTIIEAFFVPVRLNKIEPEKVNHYLKNNGIDVKELTPPTLSFCSPATVFIFKGTKNRIIS